MIAGCGKLATCEDGAGEHSERAISVREALAVALAAVVPLRKVERVDLQDSVGRVIAGKLEAPWPTPSFDQSAMDGFAVRTSDLAGNGPWHFPVVATIAAGDRPEVCVRTQTGAMRIYTGAPVPAALDAVVMAEHCEDDGETVVIGRRPFPGENIRNRGSDIARDALLVAAGTQIEPRHIGLLAANGSTAIDVIERPRIGVFSTGRELLANGGQDGGRIHDANRPTLIALAREAGADVVDLGIADDDFDETVRFFQKAGGKFDLLISSGGVSVGARDFVRTAFVEAGGLVHAWKVALKPGKPTLFGSLKGGAYLGLPGNPLSAFVGFQLFGRQQILRLRGSNEPASQIGRAIASFSVVGKMGRTEIVPVRVVSQSREGVPTIEIVGNGSSGTLYALCQADGFALIPPEVEGVAVGDLIDLIPLSSGRSTIERRALW